jgi:acyl-CoA thioester hydrolase
MSGVLSYKAAVYPWHCDIMGHMNTQFYAAAFDAAGLSMLSNIASTEVLKGLNAGWADVRQLIEYRIELLAGTVIEVRSRVLRAGNSSITVLHTMTQGASTAISSTCETKTVLFDLKRRKSLPFNDEQRQKIVELQEAP